MENKHTLDQLRMPHPQQERIDAESARLLYSTAKKSGGSGAWIPPVGTPARRTWRQSEPFSAAGGR
jgi:hypothetical protein